MTMTKQRQPVGFATESDLHSEFTYYDGYSWGMRRKELKWLTKENGGGRGNERLWGEKQAAGGCSVYF